MNGDRGGPIANFSVLTALLLASLVNVVVLVGWRVIDPTSLSWIGGDPWQNQIAWEFLRREPRWSFPPTWVYSLGYPIGVSAALSDTIPLLALPFRLFAPLLPDEFQYLGLLLVVNSILQHSGAKYLAGYDFEGRFPWLDIALQWEGDRRHVAKRTHAADGLLQLVDAVALQCEPDRRTISQPIADDPAFFSALGWWDGKPVVCVHLAAGAAIKQWPSEYFSQLIDRMVEEYDIRVALIGTPDDADLGAQVRRGVRDRRRVHACFGGVGLDRLPLLLSRSVLFVGNDSGPKHIAAGLGIPTVGVHSGVVSKDEWGPMGAMAVAISRDVVCAPCYLTKPEDCHRELACLRLVTPGHVYRICETFLATVPRRRPPSGRSRSVQGRRTTR